MSNINNLRKFDLSLKEEGLFSKLCGYIVRDGTNKVKFSTKKSLAEAIGIKFETLNNYAKVLEKYNLIKFIVRDGIYVNPNYYTATQRVNRETLDIFLIKSESLHLKDMKCIYFLYNKNKELLYIGKSINLNKRITEHRKNNENVSWKNEIVFYKYIEYASIADMNLYEVYYISKLKPEYNKEYITGDFLNIELPEKNTSDYFLIKGI